MKAFVVVDIGGTSLRTAIYTEEGNLINVRKESSLNFIVNNENIQQLQRMTVDRVISIVNEYIRKEEYTITGLGISFPGLVDKEGAVASAATLWGPMENKFPLLELLKGKLEEIHIEVINDITAAGWRYRKQITENFCIITISSGIGNKVFWDNEVLLGKDNIGGEIGHFYYGGKYKNLECDCGKKGHLGAISSGRGVEKLCRLLKMEHHDLYEKSILYDKKDITTYDIIQGVQKQDTFSLLVLEESIKPLAKACSFLHSCIGISKFVIIGGFSLAVGPLYINILRKHFHKYQAFNLSKEKLNEVFMLGESDDNHGLIGMGKYLTQKVKSDV